MCSFSDYAVFSFLLYSLKFVRILCQLPEEYAADIEIKMMFLCFPKIKIKNSSSPERLASGSE